MTMTTKTFAIQGFHCSGCADNLDKSISTLEGVIKARADYDQARVEVRFDPERVTDDDIRERIQATGFDTEGIE